MRDPSDTPGSDRPLSERHEPPGAWVGQAELAKPASAPPALTRLKRRADFLHAAKGKRWHGKALSLHAAPARVTPGNDARTDKALHDRAEAHGRTVKAGDGVPMVARVGFTLTKKVGNAVVRNRARRRLREAIRLSGDLPVQPGYDYVVIGRIDAVRVPFAALRREVVRALSDVHGVRSGKGKPRASGPRPQGPGPLEEPSPRQEPSPRKPNADKTNADKPRTIRP